MFRSEEMALCQMFIQPEAAYATVSELGEIGVVQFRDLNSDTNAFNRRFVVEVRLCDEMERRLRYLHSILLKEDIPMRTTAPVETRKPLNPRELMELETSIEADEARIRDPSNNFMELKSRLSEISENIVVLERASELFTNEYVRDSPPPSPSPSARSDQDILIEDSGFLTGIIEKQKIPTFERMVWRVSHGYAFLKTLDMETDNGQSEKSIFVLYFQGTTIHSHILTICRGFRAKIYYYPVEKIDRLQLQTSLQSHLNDLKTIIDETQSHRRELLFNIAENILARRDIIMKMKSVYHVLNYFNLDISSECFIGECWIPKKRIGDIKILLEEKSASCAVTSFLNILETTAVPPTYYQSNKFTKGFQSLIDTYGYCTYGEVNPAFLSIVTFPFLFGIMFGDIGHGLILVLFGIYTILNEKKIQASNSDNEIWNLFFFGRYIILLMGLFSVYTGIIYNDIFSKSLNVFGTNWKVNYNITEVMENDEMTLDPAHQALGTYPVGIDPIWQLAHNKILFLNSYKMKLSIIIGVLHMITGVFMSIFNHVHFKKKVNVLMEFLPRMIFLLCIFGYLCLLLFLKWALYSASSLDPEFTPFCAPSILVMFINMVLMQKPHPNKSCSSTIFAGQMKLQMVLLILAIICIPVMLLMKPMILIFSKFWRRFVRLLRKRPLGMRIRQNIIFWRQSRLEASEADPLLASSSSDNSNSDQPEPSCSHIEPSSYEEVHYGLSDIFILQAIHTIEFVLSTVSHTASYLRLWALSLAHSQLSEVLWSRLISGPSHLRGPFAGVFLWGAFAGWAVLTVTVLVLMEGLSAFLHTLRLHWVEYMSKFYSGEGYNFQPFSFRQILENDF